MTSITPPDRVAIALASAVVHAEEFLDDIFMGTGVSVAGNPDVIAFRQVLNIDDVKQYLVRLDEQGLLPVKR